MNFDKRTCGFFLWGSRAEFLVWGRAGRFWGFVPAAGEVFLTGRFDQDEHDHHVAMGIASRGGNASLFAMGCASEKGDISQGVLHFAADLRHVFGDNRRTPGAIHDECCDDGRLVVEGERLSDDISGMEDELSHIPPGEDDGRVWLGF